MVGTAEVENHLNFCCLAESDAKPFLVKMTPVQLLGKRLKLCQNYAAKYVDWKKLVLLFCLLEGQREQVECSDILKLN